MAKERLKKVTILIPEDLLRRAMKASGQGLTPTVRHALEQIALRDVYKYLRSLRGKVKLGINLKELRRD